MILDIIGDVVCTELKPWKKKSKQKRIDGVHVTLCDLILQNFFFRRIRRLTLVIMKSINDPKAFVALRIYVFRFRNKIHESWFLDLDFVIS